MTIKLACRLILGTVCLSGLPAAAAAAEDACNADPAGFSKVFIAMHSSSDRLIDPEKTFNTFIGDFQKCNITWVSERKLNDTKILAGKDNLFDKTDPYGKHERQRQLREAALQRIKDASASGRYAVVSFLIEDKDKPEEAAPKQLNVAYVTQIFSMKSGNASDSIFSNINTDACPLVINAQGEVLDPACLRRILTIALKAMSAVGDPDLLRQQQTRRDEMSKELQSSNIERDNSKKEKEEAERKAKDLASRLEKAEADTRQLEQTRSLTRKTTYGVLGVLAGSGVLATAILAGLNWGSSFGSQDLGLGCGVMRNMSCGSIDNRLSSGFWMAAGATITVGVGALTFYFLDRRNQRQQTSRTDPPSGPAAAPAAAPPTPPSSLYLYPSPARTSQLSPGFRPGYTTAQTLSPARTL